MTDVRTGPAPEIATEPSSMSSGPPSRARSGRARAYRLIRPILGAALIVGVVAGLVAGILIGRAERSDSASSSGSSSGVATSGTAASGPAHVHNADEVAEAAPDVPLDAATRAQLATQLTEARAVAMGFPTVADATRAGYVPAGGFAPETGAHYQQLQVPTDVGADGLVDAAHPASLIYDGNSPTSRIVGLMYESLEATPPAGFAGPNDHWHRHSNVCVKFGAGDIQIPFVADSDVTEGQCRAVGGTFMKKTIWMVHTWVVPSWESPLGVFSHNNPNLVCADGTLNADARGFCPGT